MLNYKSCKVLYVDDDMNDIEILREILKDEVQLLVTTDPEDALLMVKQRVDIAVVISDQRMPKISGEEVLFRAKNICPNIITVLITSHRDYGSLVNSVNKGELYRYIDKASSPKEKRAHIRQAIEAYHEQIEMKRFRKMLNRYEDITVVEIKPEHDRMLAPVNRVEPYDIPIFHATLAYFLAFENIVYGNISKPEKHHNPINKWPHIEGLERYTMSYRSIADIDAIRVFLEPYFSVRQIESMCYGKRLTREYLDEVLKSIEVVPHERLMLREDVLMARHKLNQIVVYASTYAAIIQQQPEVIVYQAFQKEPKEKIILRHEDYIFGEQLTCALDEKGKYIAIQESEAIVGEPHVLFDELIAIIQTDRT